MVEQIWSIFHGYQLEIALTESTTTGLIDEEQSLGSITKTDSDSEQFSYIIANSDSEQSFDYIRETDSNSEQSGYITANAHLEWFSAYITDTDSLLELDSSKFPPHNTGFRYNYGQ